MTQEEYKECFEELKAEFPTAKNITISYRGSGDSFEDFDDVIIDGKEQYSYNRDEKGLLQQNKEFEFDASKYNDLLFAALDCSDADFNNDGASGTITINLEEETITVDNYYYYTESSPSGEITLNASMINRGEYVEDSEIYIK